MQTLAVVLEAPQRLALSRVGLLPATDEDVVVDVEWSGISTGTERLLWSGRMPPFPGMGYPLVPGYESVGRIRACGSRSGRRVGERVFVPGSKGF
jgi:bacteriochlorophyllide a dehydrogenase